jgi:hypothetical protein
MNSLMVMEQSSSLLESMHAGSNVESRMIFYDWADIEEVLKMSKRIFDSYFEGRVAIKYCMLTGCIFLN